MHSRRETMITLGLLLLACTAGFAAANPDPPAPPFAGEPEDGLVRCLELPTAARAVPAGLAVEPQRRWLPDAQALCLETRLHNAGDAPR